MAALFLCIIIHYRYLGQGLVVAFLWLSDRLYASAEVDDCVRRLLVRISEQLPASPDEHTDDASAL